MKRKVKKVSNKSKFIASLKKYLASIELLNEPVGNHIVREIRRALKEYKVE